MTDPESICSLLAHKKWTPGRARGDGIRSGEPDTYALNLCNLCNLCNLWGALLLNQALVSITE